MLQQLGGGLGYFSEVRQGWQALLSFCGELG
jgi:hypothetical protein